MALIFSFRCVILKTTKKVILSFFGYSLRLIKVFNFNTSKGGTMLITDKCGMISHIKKLAQSNYSCEHCAVAIAESKISKNRKEMHQ